MLSYVWDDLDGTKRKFAVVDIREQRSEHHNSRKLAVGRCISRGDRNSIGRHVRVTPSKEFSGSDTLRVNYRQPLCVTQSRLIINVKSVTDTGDEQAR